MDAQVKMYVEKPQIKGIITYTVGERETIFSSVTLKAEGYVSVMVNNKTVLRERISPSIVLIWKDLMDMDIDPKKLVEEVINKYNNEAKYYEKLCNNLKKILNIINDVEFEEEYREDC